MNVRHLHLHAAVGTDKVAWAIREVGIDNTVHDYCFVAPAPIILTYGGRQYAAARHDQSMADVLVLLAALRMAESVREEADGSRTEGVSTCIHCGSDYVLQYYYLEQKQRPTEDRPVWYVIDQHKSDRILRWRAAVLTTEQELDTLCQKALAGAVAVGLPPEPARKEGRSGRRTVLPPGLAAVANTD